MKLSMSVDFRILKRNNSGEYVPMGEDEVRSVGIGGFCFDIGDKKIPFDWTAYSGSWDDRGYFSFSTGYGWMNDFELDECYNEEYEKLGIKREDISAKILASAHGIDEFYVNFDIEAKDGLEECGVGENTDKDAEFKLELLRVSFNDIETERVYSVNPSVLSAFNNGEKLYIKAVEGAVNTKGVLCVRPVAAEICDLLEEVLDKYDLTVPCEDREGEEGEARLFGDVYFNLEADVTDVLATLCKTVKENPDVFVNGYEIDELMPVSDENELKVRKFAVKICGLFEDLMDEHDITVPSNDREGEEGEARIYGDVYYNLEDEVTAILVGLCEEVKATPDIVINVEDYNSVEYVESRFQPGVDKVIAEASLKSMQQENKDKNNFEFVKE